MNDRTKTAACPGCGGSELFVSVRRIASGGGHAPDLLPGLHPWYRGARMHAVVCASCGLYRQYADSDARARLPQSPSWRRL